MSRSVHGYRGLLNLPGHHSSAAVVVEVQDTSEWPVDHAPSGDEYESYNIGPEIVCKITDCDSFVNIELDLSTANQLENSLYKIDTLIEAFSSVREGLIIEHHRLHDRLPHVDPKRRDGRYGSNRLDGKRSDILPYNA